LTGGDEEEIKRSPRQAGSEHLDTASLVQDLTVAKQQLVEIAKALMNESRILVMDEPTSALTETEARALFAVIETLKKQESP
jgi:ribose transport system ATP-binding protein